MAFSIKPGASGILLEIIYLLVSQIYDMQFLILTHFYQTINRAVNFSIIFYLTRLSQKLAILMKPRILFHKTHLESNYLSINRCHFIFNDQNKLVYTFNIKKLLIDLQLLLHLIVVNIKFTLKQVDKIEIKECFIKFIELYLNIVLSGVDCCAYVP